jgi:hypothetical protein
VTSGQITAPLLSVRPEQVPGRRKQGYSLKPTADPALTIAGTRLLLKQANGPLGRRYRPSQGLYQHGTTPINKHSQSGSRTRVPSLPAAQDTSLPTRPELKHKSCQPGALDPAKHDA